jgi:hypothetical protein
MKLSLDELQLLQVLFTGADHEGLLNGQTALKDLREKITREANRLSNPDAWERDERAIRASERAKHWNVAGCAVGRALASEMSNVLAHQKNKNGVDARERSEKATFTITDAELRSVVAKVNRYPVHPSTMTGLLMHRLHLAEPMFKKLTKAEECQFIYDRDSKVVFAEVQF